MSKKFLFSIFVIFCLVATFFYLKVYASQYKIVGVLSSVDEKSINIYGRYDSPNKDELKNITVGISKDVKITRTFFILPPQTRDNSEPFIADKLPKEVSEVGIESLIEDEKNVTIGIEVDLEKNWFNFSPVAKEIRYTGPKY